MTLNAFSGGKRRSPGLKNFILGAVAVVFLGITLLFSPCVGASAERGSVAAWDFESGTSGWFGAKGIGVGIANPAAAGLARHPCTLPGPRREGPYWQLPGPAYRSGHTPGFDNRFP